MAQGRLPRRRWLAPEVVQTSAMDCGPAALKCLLEGHRIPVSYGRLREACQTDVDGTSIDTLEEVANQLGLEAEQTMLPVDHLLAAEAKALPALAVARLPNGMTHFVVVWRRHGSWVQVMDPGVGRRWFRPRALLDELYLHTMPVPATAWRAWVESEEFKGALRRRLLCLGLRIARTAALMDDVLTDSSWKSAAALDAGTRFVESLVQSGGISRGRQAGRVLQSLLVLQRTDVIPEAYWSVHPAPTAADGEEQLWLRGAVVLRVLGRKDASPPASTELEEAPAQQRLSLELAAALDEKPARPTRDLIRFMRADGLLAPSIVIMAMALAAAGVTVEAVLLRGILDLGKELGAPRQRLAALAVLVAFVVLITLLELPIAAGLRRFGRKLESRLRSAFLEKIPRLGDRYFQSRPISDMAERSHSVHELRTLPPFGGALLRAVFEVVFTVAGIVWLYPFGVPFAILAAVIAIGLPMLFQPMLAERDLRVRTHLGALGRFYLDSLLGMVPIRVHGAERSVRREHERVLTEWARSGIALQRLAVTAEGVQSIIGLGLAVGLLFGYLSRKPEVGGVLLMVYWALNLPLLGQKVAVLAWQYPSLRNLALRLFEPLGAPEEAAVSSGVMRSESDSVTAGASESAPVSLRFENVTVRVSGHVILQDIGLEIQGGSHVAIVGASGAGKSTLVGLLLGWHKAAVGEVLVNGNRLEGMNLEALRQATAWVDPAVQLWNRSLFDNLHYGMPSNGSASTARSIEAADLRALLETLPDGLQTFLGEGGALVSGGEGQRVRFGRALLRTHVSLAILDEPFRGLDREKRRLLLARARELWRNATLLCITHDVAETRSFERVLVIEGGQIVEDGRPSELAARADSRYCALLAAQEQVQKTLWSDGLWRRWRMQSGRLHERGAEAVT